MRQYALARDVHRCQFALAWTCVLYTTVQDILRCVMCTTARHAPVHDRPWRTTCSSIPYVLARDARQREMYNAMRLT